MRLSNLTLCLLMTATTAAAQVAGVATVISSTVQAGSSVAAAVAPGTNVWGGLSRAVNSGVGSASVATLNKIHPGAADLRWQLSSQAVNSGTSSAELDLRYELSSPVLQSGNLIVDWSPLVAGTGQATLAVDVFNDGYVDAFGSDTIPVVFQSPYPLFVRVTVRITSNAGTIQGPFGSSWSWSGSAAAQLRIRFEPDHAHTTTHALQPCTPHPSHEVIPDLSRNVYLQGMAEPTDHLAVFALGLQPTSVPLPLSPNCLLLVNPVVTLGIPLQPHVPASVPLFIPPAGRPATFFTQMITLNGTAGTLSASRLKRTIIN